MALMTAVERLTDPSWDYLLQDFLELSTPEGYRAQLIDWEIVVTPPPDGDHETIFSELSRQFMLKSKLDVRVLPNKGLIVPGGRFIPDGTVCAPGRFRNADPWADPADVPLVFEITSTRPAKDRGAKRAGYAAAGIPCYLLVDRGRAEVTLFLDPEDGDYRSTLQVALGKPLKLPAPFSFELDTAPFL